MKFIKLEAENEAADFLYGEIVEATKSNDHVIWLVSGGSNVHLAAEVFKRLNPDELVKITILLSDERYGSVGHPDSNYHQLGQAGVDFSRIISFPVLIEGQKDLESATENYNKVIDKMFSSTHYIIAQMGIGTDGHTAGILPHSPAIVETDKWVVSYPGGDYDRITLSIKALRSISKALVFVFGESKRQAVENLQNNTLSLSEEPAQIFSQLPVAYIINDMIGDPL